MDMCKEFPYQKENGITIYDLYYNFICEEGVPNPFDEYHVEKGELDWKDCRMGWDYYNSSMKVQAFKNKLRKIKNVFIKIKSGIFSHSFLIIMT